MSGIQRIKIQSNWSDERTRFAEKHTDVASAIYRRAFNLAAGDVDILVSKQEAMARYDWKEGIDIILTTVSGTRMTLQEKILSYGEDTATFEEEKTNGEPGAWYYCTAQYYFVGYNRKYYRNRKTYEVLPNPVIDLQKYVLIDLAALHRLDEQGQITWFFNQNSRDGRAAKFRYVYFQHIPGSCIVYPLTNSPPLQETLF